MPRIAQTLSDRSLHEDDVLRRLNREVLPVLKAMRTALNQRAEVYTVDNPVERRTFDTTTVTTQQLAEVVGTLIADLQALGWIESA